MPERVKCVDSDCDEMIPADTVRPEYEVLARPGHKIRPKPRCNRCRDAYEALRLRTRNAKGGLKLVV